MYTGKFVKLTFYYTYNYTASAPPIVYTCTRLEPVLIYTPSALPAQARDNFVALLGKNPN